MILYNLRKFHNFHFFIPKFKTVLKYFKLGNKFLLSNISTVALNYLSKLLIGIYISPSSLVSYDFFEKILNFLKGIISNIEQVILPILIKNKSVKKLNFYLKITILVFLFLVSIFIINSNSLTILFLGVEIDKPYLNSFIILVSIIPFIFSTFYCHIYLLAWKYDNKFFQIKYTSFLFYLVVLFFMFFINKNNLYYITLTYEILIALYSFYIFNSLNKYKLNEIY
jgi:O-antigen/teichoic acid export membrane protein